MIYMHSALQRTQDLLVQEKRTVKQLRHYVEQMELDMQHQTHVINSLLMSNQSNDEKIKSQVGQHIQM